MIGTADWPEACRISIRGVVQGVGFRPFVYAVAAGNKITGWIKNTDAGIEIHAEGSATNVASFVQELQVSCPAAARISSLSIRATDVDGWSDFTILPSIRKASPRVLISADLAVCQDCLLELHRPEDRRYRYPYINCTNCGPRYSIIQQLPYDRESTTMAAWKLCDACQREYDDPTDRRHHAQPTACPKCGPIYQFVQDVERRPTGDAAVWQASALLRDGGILAVKGIGGYHLACDAWNAKSVEQLRTRKFRKQKPFAIMVRTLEEARQLAELTAEHERLLTLVSRPIVIASARRQLPGVAPDSLELGVMLPYAPLHYLLFEAGAPSPLVMTSANKSSEPIAFRDQDAFERLGGLADAFLIGQRPIARRVEDSVIAVRHDQPFMLRRSRGFSPGVVASLPTDQPILAVGGDFKNAMALLVDGEVLVSQYIGDLDDWDTYTAFEETAHDLLKMYGVKRSELVVAHDLHPHFKSSRFAESLQPKRCVAVQHHHAHIASVLAEHELLEHPVVGVAFDGTGFGSDGSIWGGEFFVGNIRTGFERRASLRSVDMPGGDAAAQFPIQAAAGFLAGLEPLPNMLEPPFLFPRRYVDAIELIHKRVRIFRSTSAGRLFDAVAALLGFTREVTYEGQAAIWLEHQASQSDYQRPYPFPSFDHRPLLRCVIEDRLAGRPLGEIAFGFHAAMAREVGKMVLELCTKRDLGKVVLSGGVFQNTLLATLVRDELLCHDHIELLTNQRVPVNDGGICLGQAALAWATVSKLTST